jgi:hypothetical protein
MNKQPGRTTSRRTSYANFLYLLHELEMVVERADMEWPVGAADVILGRLGMIAQKVALALSEADRTKLH